MALSGRLRAYLALERAMMDLDDHDDPLADDLRDAMDKLWVGLEETEHAWLDARFTDAHGRPTPRPPEQVRLLLSVTRARHAKDRARYERALAWQRASSRAEVLSQGSPDDHR
ncbi:MAG: hypothetical protein KF729_09415 [Sandaracinaceae bacterium]|nr:hypothetical protein [Sandaracinaceae bacterium]